MRTKLVALSISGVLAVTAIAVTSPQATSKPKPYVALVVGESGGFVMPEYNFSRLPRVVLYSDGRMFARSDVMTAQYPGPAVQTILTKSAGGSVSKIINAVYNAKLGDSTFKWGYPGVADVNNTDVYSKVSAKAKAKQVSVYAISFTGPGLTKKQVSARTKASVLLNDLQAFSNKYVLTKSLPTSWVSNRWAYQVSEGTSNEFTTIQDWVGNPLTDRVSCAVLSADASKQLVTLLPSINQETLFRSNDKLWKVTLRPLFPHETGCASLGYK